MSSSSDARRLGRDLLLPSTSEESLRTTPTGDIRSVEGRDNIDQAMRNRALASPGDLLHRPEYGGGLPMWVEEAAAPEGRARMASDLRRNALRDPRLSDAKVTVSQGTPSDPSRPGTVTVQLDVRVRDDPDDQQITLVAQE